MQATLDWEKKQPILTDTATEEVKRSPELSFLAPNLMSVHATVADTIYEETAMSKSVAT